MYIKQIRMSTKSTERYKSEQARVENFYWNVCVDGPEFFFFLRNAFNVFNVLSVSVLSKKKLKVI